MNQTEKAKFLEEFGGRVKRFRNERGLSQEELANLVGYTSEYARSSINKIEAGKSDLPASKIHALAKALNVPISQLMGWADEFDRSFDTKKLQDEVNIIEQIQDVHGKIASEAFSMFLQLDKEDQLETLDYMGYKLSKDKYSIQKESSVEKAM